jgi:NAD(P)-dependent dehydrogenase (short-subunit alcohol dehydrogenase family)
MMDITGKTALVTGANRGLGRAFAEALLEACASKVYAGARDPSTGSDPRSTPIRLDVTSSHDVAATAEACGDVEILINNAGVMLSTPVLSENSENALRREMEVNVLVVESVCRRIGNLCARYRA